MNRPPKGEKLRLALDDRRSLIVQDLHQKATSPAEQTPRQVQTLTAD